MRCAKTTLIAAAALLFCALAAVADVAPTMNYQGMLYDDQGQPLQGLHDLTFKIYPTPSGFTTPALWSEWQREVPITDGLFSVMLGTYETLSAGLFANEELWLAVAVDDDDEMSPRMPLTSVPYSFRTAVADSAISSGGADGDWTVSGDNMYASVSGNIGIGTSNPPARLSIDGGNAESGLRVAWGNNYGNLYGEFKHQGSGGLVINSRAGGGWADIRFQTENNTKMFIERAGNVGIGTESPARKLEVADDGVAYARLTSGSAQGSTLELKTTSADGGTWNGRINFIDASDNIDGQISYYDIPFFDQPGMYFRSGGSTRLMLGSDGDVGVGTSSPSEKLDVIGNVRCQVLKITGGADIAEPFDIGGRDRVEAGMVLSIDPDEPGSLRLAASAYDRCVAGVVSGAGGIGTGLLMGQQGSAADGAHPVALSGRVYCLVTAANGSVAPGDLLTTSDLPGHAMKATDHERAQGAVLGKAMGALSEGEGLVLVLVSLQ
jgi:hypothetical protein